jgi:hypothetical protein
MSRESAIRYIQARAKKLRAKADSGEQGWAAARHDAWLLDAIASDLMAGLDEGEDA